ncbi:AraC family transcriptional regulator [Paenibacillus rhizosphaerae]|uniref:AraC family transcriptional regulator n=1 Tax=Paenibacillus rhizosphaerae TaxID=297318 RepID=A0A1R1F1K1_9BACL|nr:AraC family transcriptional regulator [Paenibacillus rhizosphaerae]OMF57965.1 AraC family transcriptional regulator [Paenibacillus rhizosphaerae]
MTYPRDLWEDTALENTAYPFQLFQNRCLAARAGHCILYLHWHEHFELLVMKRGSAVFHIDSRPYAAAEGDVLIIPGGSLHVGYSLAEGDVHYDCIVVNASLFNDWLHDPIHIQYVAPYLEGRLRFPVKISCYEEGHPGHLAHLEEIIRELSSKPPAYQLTVKSRLHLFLTLLARENNPSMLEAEAHNAYFPNRERFKQLIRHIESNFSDKMTIEQAARQVSLNPYYFCKLFKRLTGRTFVEYVNICRVKEARRLLTETNESVTEIASRVGLDNPNYFTKLYKKYMGTTPTRERKS